MAQAFAMMSLGSMLYKIRSAVAQGPRVAYWRDLVCPRVLQTKPIRRNTDRICEIHVLTCRDDWLNMMWTLKSFYWASQRDYALCIHDDGSLTSHELSILRDHFPDANLIDPTPTDQRVRASLANYPLAASLHEQNLLARKLFAFSQCLQSDRMLLLDSDVLFFREPVELLRRVEDTKYCNNSVNRDIQSAYTVTTSVAMEQCGVNLIERFNSGLGVIHRDSIRPDWIEEFLGMPGILGHPWRIEQTLYALCSSRFGCQLLPDEYDVRLGDHLRGEPVRHYVGTIRHRMYVEGMRRLVRLGFLQDMSVGSPHEKSARKQSTVPPPTERTRS